MTDVTFDETGIHVEFPGWERLMAGRRRFTAPIDTITSVRVEDDWTSEILGVRSGLVISGFVKLGTFRHPRGERRLVSMRRGKPLLRVGLDRATTGFDELLLSTDGARDLAGRITEGISRSDRAR